MKPQTPLAKYQQAYRAAMRRELVRARFLDAKRRAIAARMDALRKVA